MIDTKTFNASTQRGLSLREKQLIERFRACDERGKAGIEAASKIELEMMNDFPERKAAGGAIGQSSKHGHVLQFPVEKE